MCYTVKGVIAMVDIKRTKNMRCGNVAKVTFELRESVEEERRVIEILEDIEGKDVFLRDAVTKFAASDEFKKNRANLYDGPGHHKKSTK